MYLKINLTCKANKRKEFSNLYISLIGSFFSLYGITVKIVYPVPNLILFELDGSKAVCYDCLSAHILSLFRLLNQIFPCQEATDIRRIDEFDYMYMHLGNQFTLCIDDGLPF